MMTQANCDIKAQDREGPKEASSSVRKEGAIETKILDVNSADEVRRMTQALLKNKRAPDLHLDDSDPEPSQEMPSVEDDSVTQKDLPTNPNKSAHDVADKKTTIGKWKTKRGIKKELSRQGKNRAKFINRCKGTASVSMFYSGKLSNYIRFERRR